MASDKLYSDMPQITVILQFKYCTAFKGKATHTGSKLQKNHEVLM